MQAVMVGSAGSEIVSSPFMQDLMVGCAECDS